MIRVTITEPLPRLLPRISRATGIMATIRMMQGMLRKKLTTKPSTQLMMRQAVCFPFPTWGRPFLSVTHRITPMGRPKR